MSAPGVGARIGSGLADLPARVDVLVVGLGVTGAGVALDAVTRGLSVLAVDAHDVAFGTSRWSSKLVHGGLRYLAHGQVGVAHESAVERDVLMRRTAPHLVRALPMVLPLHPEVGRGQERLTHAGLRAGDLLRAVARTPRSVLPRPRRLGVAETLALAPGVRRSGLRGSLLSWDGQLEDDARLVLALARTAAAHGADVRTHVRVDGLAAGRGDGTVTLVDGLTGARGRVGAGVVVNAAGVWAGQVADGVRLRPSRGTHLVLRADALPGGSAVMAPVPGSTSRFVFALPQPDGLVYAGLTDEPVDHVDDVPLAPESDVRFLLEVLARVLQRPPSRADVVGTFAGLRPLLEGVGDSSDLSRRHAVLRSTSAGAAGPPVVTVVGGKLTTYRRMAQDAVDAAVDLVDLVGPRAAGPCRTRDLPLLGAADAAALAAVDAPARLVRRFGAEAPAVLASAARATGRSPADLAAPVHPEVPVTRAELVFGVTHEGARTRDDLLERRTRVALVPADVPAVLPAVDEALALRGSPG